MPRPDPLDWLCVAPKGCWLPLPWRLEQAAAQELTAEDIPHQPPYLCRILAGSALHPELPHRVTPMLDASGGRSSLLLPCAILLPFSETWPSINHVPPEFLPPLGGLVYRLHLNSSA